MLKDQNPVGNESPCNATAMRKASRRLSQLYDVAAAGRVDDLVDPHRQLLERR